MGPLAGAVNAQSGATSPPAAQDDQSKSDPLARPTPAPTVHKAETLDTLFTKLKRARSKEEAKSINQAIQVRWLDSGSATVDLLMRRALKAMESKDYPLSLDILDAVVDLKPDYAEGWNKRATVHYLRQDFGRSIGDIEQALKLEPRHFGALSGLGSIFRQLGKEEDALRVFEQALTIYPRLESIQKAYSDLIDEIDGRGI
ncbi:MAG: tetratricopeptide repeat protein [Pseudomonadota bacterium]